MGMVDAGTESADVLRVRTCGVGVWVCCVRTWMSVNKNEKKLTWNGGRRCVACVHIGVTYLVHMRADADGGPVKKNKTKQKEKKKYLSLDADGGGCGWMRVDADGERGWVAVVADGRWWLQIGQGL